ncbi:hypothetical protein D3C85_1328850 [compost metagenome]
MIAGTKHETCFLCIHLYKFDMVQNAANTQAVVYFLTGFLQFRFTHGNPLRQIRDHMSDSVDPPCFKCSVPIQERSDMVHISTHHHRIGRHPIVGNRAVKGEARTAFFQLIQCDWSLVRVYAARFVAQMRVNDIGLIALDVQSIKRNNMTAGCILCICPVITQTLGSY